MAIITPVGIVSYPKLFSPEQILGQGPKKFQVALMFDPNDPGLAMLKAEAGKKANEFFKGNIPPKFKNPFIDGNTLDDPAAKGKIVIRFSCKEDRPPQVIGPDKQPLTQVSGAVYAGCLGRVSTNCYGYDTAGNKGVAFGLNNFQKTGDGARIDGRKSADEEFDSVATPQTDIFGNPAAAAPQGTLPSWF
jgi:hypothetical protein